MPAQWYKPVCDQVLKRLYAWYLEYERGEVYATRAYIPSTPEEIAYAQANKRSTIEKPTIYAHRIIWHPNEMQHLIRMLREEAPTCQLIPDFEKAAAGLKTGLLLPGGYYRILMAFYKDDIKEVIELLLQIRNRGAAPSEMDKIAAAQKDSGKALFEQ